MQRAVVSQSHLPARQNTLRWEQLAKEENTSKGQRGGTSIQFDASLFITAALWKQPNCPSTGGWTGKKMWCMCTVECFSSIKKKKGRILSCRKMDAAMDSHTFPLFWLPWVLHRYIVSLYK
jgi:hypothetical protein